MLRRDWRCRRQLIITPALIGRGNELHIILNGVVYDVYLMCFLLSLLDDTRQSIMVARKAAKELGGIIASLLALPTYYI